jgi:hypothetical protein
MARHPPLATAIGKRALLLAMLACLAGPALAQPTEQAVKAAFLPKFARYVSWPTASRSTGPLQLCMVGVDTLGPLVDQAALGQQVDQQPIAIRRIASVSQASNCHIAFVNGSNSQSTAAMLAPLRGRPVLTVTDDRSGPHRGIVHFTLHQGRVRFYIDAAAAARSKLAIDSRLLAIALGVKQRPA